MSIQSHFFQSLQNKDFKYIIFLTENALYYMKRSCCYLCPIQYYKKRDIKKLFYLYQTENTLTVLDAHLIDFKTSQLYFDDINTYFPQYDTLYIKVNPHFFVSYDNFCRSITHFYFTLYSSIFSKFGLENMSCEVSNQLLQSRNVTGSLHAGVGALDIQYEKKKEKSLIEIRDESFYINPDNYENIVMLQNMPKEKRIDYIYKHYVPGNQKNIKIMFRHSIDMSLVNKIIEEKQNKVSYSFKVNTKEIESIWVHLGEVYTPLNVSINFKNEVKDEKIHSILFTYNFFNENEIMLQYNMRYKDDLYYITTNTSCQNPHPINASQIANQHNISQYKEVLSYAKQEIMKNPIDVFVEIKRHFHILYGTRYDIITWHVSKEKTKLIFKRGIRYLLFSKKLFRDKDVIIQQIQKCKCNDS